MAREIKALRAHGLRIALDDFGTGFASLAHLMNVPVDVLKIEKSFIDRLECGGLGLAIVEPWSTLSRKLDMSVVAEGVESETQASLLAGTGCQLGQGYLFSQAVSGSIATGLLARFAQPLDDNKIMPAAYSRAN
ncbi:EAL domain-containing protein [Mesorhizobium sp. CO1-1-8]|uniref:EAL domain-containing protein n=1 Tax=Mesorhizobium sp. CO1-1-8 TaxID=2876631 RepID=UPI001CD11590|nr:EAL domain-containing protein [Mesorhizobium sp. CO1-1-8]MBZ9774986.1 EAL domain-containing protein [Mesorhizobium sp. CO1-1-8]